MKLHFSVLIAAPVIINLIVMIVFLDWDKLNYPSFSAQKSLHSSKADW